MSKKRSFLAIVCTVLLVLTGAAMPSAVSAFQDRRLETQSGSRETLDVELTLRKADNMGGTLTLFSTQHLSYELTKNGQEHTEEQAETAAQDIVDLLQQEGLITREPLEVVKGKSSVTFHVTEADSSLFSVVWRCMFKQSDETYLTIFIDDTTGKLVGIPRIPTAVFKPGSDAPDREAVFAEAWRWADFCKSYYGFDTVSVQEQEYHPFYATFLLVSTGGAEDEYVQCEIPLTLTDGYVYFNSAQTFATAESDTGTSTATVTDGES